MNLSLTRNIGLTLIEVLIALAILSLALTAVIRTTSQSIIHTRYLENKTQANWVAERVMNEARLGLIKLPKEPDFMEKEIESLGKPWRWQGMLIPTSNKYIFKIQIEVWGSTDNQKYALLTSYLSTPRLHSD